MLSQASGDLVVLRGLAWVRSGISLVLFLTIVLVTIASRAFPQDKYIAEGDTWRYFKGTEEPPVDWAALNFNDSTWTEGATPMGYSTDLTYKTVLSDMQNKYLSVYMRKKFTVDNPSEVKLLRLAMKYDDGFVVYLNGTEAVRRNILGDPGTAVPFDSTATDHETNAATWEYFLFYCEAMQALVQGENVLAIQAHNASLGSSDLSADPELFPVLSADTCPKTFTCTPGTGAAGPQVVLRWTKTTAAVSYDAIVITRNGAEVVHSLGGTATTLTDKTPDEGTNNYELAVSFCGQPCGAPLTCSCFVGDADPKFRRGDVDRNGSMELTDAVIILNHLFRGEAAPACLDAADSDDNSAVELTDPIFILQALFQGKDQPPLPGSTNCGVDPTADDLAPCVYSSC